MIWRMSAHLHRVVSFEVPASVSLWHALEGDVWIGEVSAIRVAWRDEVSQYTSHASRASQPRATHLRSA